MTVKKTFDEKKFTTNREWKMLSLETWKLAVQADSSVLLKFQENALLFSTVMQKNPKPDMDFLPLMVDFRESFSAAWKLWWAAYRRREWRPSDSNVLYARIIDRALRPMFPKWMINDVVITVSPLALDLDYHLGAISIIGSSVSVMSAGIPFDWPIWAVQLGYKDWKYLINPTKKELDECTMNLLVSWKKWTINMIECEANEVPENVIKKAFEIGQEEINKSCDFQSEFLLKLVIKQQEIKFNKPSEELMAYISNILTQDKLEAMTWNSKEPFNDLYYKYENEVKELAKEKISDLNEEDFTESKIKIWVFNTVKHFIRHRTLEKWLRIDDRKMEDIRPLYCEAWFLPRVHGSGLFRRWDTQVLSTTTLGGPGEYMIIDDMENEQVKTRYMHHYNFPPFSTWEAGVIRWTGRREIWHGRLAEKALEIMLPSKDVFPYTIRVVSDCLGSGGSTSMWSVCGSTLSLMDAWVPIKKPVAGVAMWLMTDHDDAGNITKYNILTDLMGTEDFTWDMDFKVAWTRDGITAIQLDTKLKGLTMEIIHNTITKAIGGYNQIMDFMLETIAEPRKTVSQYAPKIYVFKVHPDKIKEVIGRWGEIINKIIEACDNVKIDFDDDGTCFLTHVNQVSIDKALEMIKDIVEDLEVWQVYEWTISRIEEYGLFIKLPKNKMWLCHVSALGPTAGKDLTKQFKIWDKMKVKITEIDDQGRLKVKKEL